MEQEGEVSYRPHFENCPFCGRSGGTFVVNATIKGADANAIEDEAYLGCACGANMRAKSEPETYRQITGELYQRIPPMRALDVLAAKWNRRVKNG